MDTKNQRDHDRLYTVHSYFCMIYLKLKKNWIWFVKLLCVSFLAEFLFYNDVFCFTLAVVGGSLIEACSDSKLFNQAGCKMAQEAEKQIV